MSKWKNKGLYVSLAALVLLVLQTYGLLPKLGLTGEAFNAIVNGILVVLGGAGIISDPTSGSGYLD